MGGSEPCACAGLSLGAHLQAQLRLRHDGCLCVECLCALAAGAPLDNADKADTRPHTAAQGSIPTEPRGLSDPAVGATMRASALPGNPPRSQT